MRNAPAVLLFALLTMSMLSLAAAEELSIDISGLSQEEYNPGEEVSFTVVLLDGETLIEQDVSIVLSDVLGKKELSLNAVSNRESKVTIREDFPGGLWTISAKHESTDGHAPVEVDRTFLVGERSGVAFSIEGDELAITNNGNIRYTRTIQITIGSHTESYLQNIGVGEERRLKLVSPSGTYDIVVTDGKTTLRRQNIELFGTGNVIGAVDKKLLGYTGFAGAEEVAESGDRQVSLSKLPVSLTFIAAVFILGILVFAERRMTRKRKRR